MRVDCILESNCLLGESPLWSVKEGVLYWVDIRKPALHRLDPLSNVHEIWEMPDLICAVGLRRAGGLIAAMRREFVTLDFATRRISPAAYFRLERRGDRFNDGKCDRQGRFWVGSMDDAEIEASGDFFRLDPSGSVRRFVAGFVVTNGIGWSPDSRTMYITDSAKRTIYACDYNPLTGTIGRRRVFARVAAEAGYPDGLTVDAEGRVWSAHWDGWRLSCYAPSGRVEKEIGLPVQRPTSCAFGGAALDVLYVTSALIGLDEATLAKEPQAGAVFSIRDTGFKGIEEPAFLG